jgi:PAS domain S-box-containing protein
LGVHCDRFEKAECEPGNKGRSRVAEDSKYVLEALREGAEFTLYRGRERGDQTSILAVTAVTEQPSAQSLQRLEHEYSLATELDPAWAAQPVALTRHRGRPILILKDPGGEPLDRVIKRDQGKPINLTKVLRIAIGLASALGHAHRQGLVHRDVKPAAALVDDSECVWLTGFGIASRLPRERLTPAAPEIIAGTFAYMSPEQTGRMNRSVDARSDLYSLGVTLYEILTGVLPFSAADALEWVHSHIARQPVPPAEHRAIPTPLSDIVMRLLAKNAEERYQTAAGLEADLRHCLSEWQSRGRIDPFPLGTDDSPDQLLIPEKLYGREREVDALVTAFDRVVTQGAAELVLVSGYSGVGKSSVVNELQKVLVPRHGIFAVGKFDQFKRDVPYATLAQAFQTLVRQILVKSEAEVDEWRRALLEALGPNGQLIVNLIPELEFVIGKQPAVLDLPPQEEMNRFQFVLRRFLGVFAKPEHPLALFLDDLQWLDAATLDLLEILLTQKSVSHLLIIGAYRDNEVDTSHPLIQKLKALRRAGLTSQDIVLAPLGCDDLGEFLADLFHCEPNRAAPLAQLIHDKTNGNPFFAIQFISTLADEGLLTFDYSEAIWSWDLNRIRAKGYTDNVVDLMVGRLTRLSVETQKALQQFACLGNNATFEMLQIVYQDSLAGVHRQLWEAVQTGLIFRSETSYSFLHDRVQEAGYSLISTELRAQSHLHIGRRLAQNTPSERRDESIFGIVNQLNRGLHLITSTREREQVAALNLVAARRAKASTALVSALKYLEAGRSLLTEQTWENNYDLIFSIESVTAECELLIADMIAAEMRLTMLSRRAKSSHDFAAVTRLQITLYTTLDRSELAIELFLEYLRRNGTAWSKHPTRLEVIHEYDRIWSLVGERQIEDLVELPLLTDPDVVDMLDVFTEIVHPAIFYDENLSSLAVCRMVNLSLEHGNGDASCFAYVWFAMFAGPRFNNYKDGFRFGQLGYDLVKTRGFTRYEARTYITFSTLMPWARHAANARELVRRAFDVARRVGDLTYSAYSWHVLITNCLMVGDHLKVVQGEAEDGLAFTTQQNFGLVAANCRAQLGLVRTLRGLTQDFGRFDDQDNNELEFERYLASNSGLALSEFFYWTRKLQGRFFAGDYTTAVDASERAHSLLWPAASQVETGEFRFYGALAHAAAATSASAAEKQRHFEALSEHQQQLEIWAEHCAPNFENRAALVRAEIARIEGRELDAERFYEAAINSARENDFVHNEALANELAARFYIARGLETAGYAHLRNARNCYDRWGARGKVMQLDERYPRLREERPAASSATIGPPVGNLDVEAVVKASQALSSEIVLPKLIEKLVRIAVEHAAAERGLLILLRGDEPWIEAEAASGPDKVEVITRQTHVGPYELPPSALNYVIRTRETVLLDDALIDNVYSKDEYVQRKRPRSILCLPIVNQNKLVGILYLENSLAPFVFTPGRVSVLQLLASQAAISLENARLYSDLELQAGLLQRIPVSAWTLRPDGTPDFVNQVWLEYSGQTLDFVRSHPEAWTTAVHPEDRQMATKFFWEGVRSGQGFAFETRSLRARDETYRWLLQQAVVLRDADGNVLKFVGTTTDIDDQKRAEEALRQTQADLAHVTRVATLNAMTASIAHEVSQPLSGILTNANTCMRNLTADPPNLTGAAETVRRTIRDAERAGQIVHRLRGMFAAKTPAMEEFDLNDAAREVITLSAGEIKKGRVLLQTKFSDDLPFVSADRVQMQQVILNLLLNAVDAMAEVADRPRALLVETDLQGADGVKLAVRDSGVGINADTIEKLFQAFYTTKEHGMGVGLSICRSIIEGLGGHLWANSNEDGPGATFTFSLPGATDRPKGA